VDAAAARNKFENCRVFRFIEHTTNHPLVELKDAVSIDRDLTFKGCEFISMSANYAIAQTGVFKVPALTQGYIIVDHCVANSGGSATVKWDANDSNKIVLFAMAAPAADTAGTEREV
jgi:hypothetical protein